LKNSPKTPEIYQELGQELHRQGCLKEAIDCYRKGMKLQGEPIHLWFYRNLGEALLELEQAI
jgi:tetratricopeptide (TPR) repeat protein